MALPMSTTTLTVLRPDNLDPYEAEHAEPSLIATVPGHVYSPSGRSQIVGGEQETVVLKAICEICDLRHTDLVRDNGTEVTYAVEWVTERRALGLDHLALGIRVVEGAA